MTPSRSDRLFASVACVRRTTALALVSASLTTPTVALGQYESETPEPVLRFRGPPPYESCPHIAEFTRAFALQEPAEWMAVNPPVGPPLPNPVRRCYAVFRSPFFVTLRGFGSGVLCELESAAADRYVLLGPTESSFLGFQWERFEPRASPEDGAPRVVSAMATGFGEAQLPPGRGCAEDDGGRFSDESAIVLHVLIDGQAEFLLLDACAETCPPSWGISRLAYGPVGNGETEHQIPINVASLRYDGCIRVSASNLRVAETNFVEVRW